MMLGSKRSKRKGKHLHLKKENTVTENSKKSWWGSTDAWCTHDGILLYSGDGGRQNCQKGGVNNATPASKEGIL